MGGKTIALFSVPCSLTEWIVKGDSILSREAAMGLKNSDI